jgi:hypothetical protein
MMHREKPRKRVLNDKQMQRSIHDLVYLVERCKSTRSSRSAKVAENVGLDMLLESKFSRGFGV